jgi:hypothetical protein
LVKILIFQKMDVKAGVKGHGAGLMPDALKSLARTDDILGAIGFVMLAGVVVGMYGSYWQGKAAQKQYSIASKEDPGVLQTLESKTGFNSLSTPKKVALVALPIAAIGVAIYLIKKK